MKSPLIASSLVRTGKRLRLPCLPACAFAIVAASVSSSIAQTSWERENLSTPSALADVCYGEGLYIATSDEGGIATSPDAEAWSIAEVTTETAIQGIGAGNDEFVAVGEGGVIFRSPDGTSWAPESSGTTNFLTDAVYANGKWVAVGGAINGSASSVLTSTTPGTWVQQDAGTTSFLSRITYGAGRFVAVGLGGTIVHSGDGESWQTATSGTTRYLSGVTYAEGSFVAVGARGTVLVSSDGIDWTSRPTGRGLWLFGIAFGNDTWVAVGELGVIELSTDLVTWTSGVSGASEDIYAISAGVGNLVAVGNNAGPKPLILRSSIPIVITVPDALDNTANVWELAGDGHWFGQNTVTFDSVDAAQSRLSRRDSRPRLRALSQDRSASISAGRSQRDRVTPCHCQSIPGGAIDRRRPKTGNQSRSIFPLAIIPSVGHSLVGLEPQN